MWRWSRWRVFGAVLMWCVVCFPILLWRSIEPRPLQLLFGMAVEIGPTLVLVALILLGNATRAVAPWLLIHTPDDVAPRIAAFDMAPDADRRYRVNECYCHDTTWQNALRALVQRSDVVLMDLRGFQAHNAGCRFELGALAEEKRALRVVALVDGQTDRSAAAASIGHAPPDRFVWLDTVYVDAPKRREVLASLFDYGRHQTA